MDLFEDAFLSSLASIEKTAAQSNIGRKLRNMLKIQPKNLRESIDKNPSSSAKFRKARADAHDNKPLNAWQGKKAKIHLQSMIDANTTPEDESKMINDLGGPGGVFDFIESGVRGKSPWARTAPEHRSYPRYEDDEGKPAQIPNIWKMLEKPRTTAGASAGASAGGGSDRPKVPSWWKS